VETCDNCTRRKNKKYTTQSGAGKREKTVAGKGIVRTIKLISDGLKKDGIDILSFLRMNESNIYDTLLDSFNELGSIKWYLTILVSLSKTNGDGEIVRMEQHFRCGNMTANTESDFENQIAEAFQALHNMIHEHAFIGSGWLIDNILEFEVSIASYKPLSGSSYFPLPKILAKKRSIINIKNTDSKCFTYSVLAGISKRSLNPNRVSQYKKKMTTINDSMLTYPVPLSQITNFEKANSISINVFGYEKREIFPLRITEEEFKTHVNLLLLSKNGKRHYCLITNLSGLFSNLTKHTNKTFYCVYCFHRFCSARTLREHKPLCRVNGPQKISFPQETFIGFKKFAYTLPVPFIIYADFETFLTEISTCDNDSNISNTTKIQRHDPCGFGLYAVAFEGPFKFEPIIYRGPNVIQSFFVKLKELEKRIVTILEKVEPANLTPEEMQEHLNATHCHICGNELLDDKVLNHNHITGKYFGAAHNKCNLSYKFQRGNQKVKNSFIIPCVIHNLSSYDAHLIMQGVGKFTKEPISCIPSNLEKYISFSIGNIRFIDSLRFLNASLSQLVDDLATEGIQSFVHMRNYFCDDIKVSKLIRKGVYPYDYMNSHERFDETCLPPRDKFFNRLSGQEISENDYAFAHEVWNMFNMKTLADYHDLYLLNDVLLLADVFENFRKMCIKYYNLDSAHFLSSPGLSWQAMLLRTGEEIEVISDIDQYLMIERSIRGGISVISNRFAKANNKYMSSFNPEKPSSYIVYFDVTNLYGYAMVNNYLPISDFSFLSQEQMLNFDVMKISDKSDIGYFLEVDLDYPKSLHDMHSDYPLAAENIEVSEEMLSEYQKQLLKRLGIKYRPVKKLIPNLFDKKNYVVHYKLLKFFLSQGLILKKVHRILEFHQKPWLKSYIEFNTEKRKNSKNETEKAFFKILSNSIYGKSLEDVRKRQNVELVTLRKRMKKIIAQPSFKSFKIFHENLVAFHMSRINVKLDKPCHAGAAILDLSKLHMYDFHYNFIKPKYGEKAKLLFTDTDSFAYHIECEDIYSDMKENMSYFDTSNYQKDHPNFSVENKGVLGLFKDELKGCLGIEFAGLRSKVYSLVHEGSDKAMIEKKVAKGVQRSTIRNNLKHEMFRDCVENGILIRSTMTSIRSDHHELNTIRMNKISLSSFDDKRYILENGYDTLAHGHYKISELNDV